MIFTDENGKKYELDHYYGGTNELVIKPIPDSPTRWRTGHGGEYWYIDLETISRTWHSEDEYNDIDNARYEWGNYFRTEEQAEAAADAIGAALEYLHWTGNGVTPEYGESIEEARKLIQNDKEQN